MKIKLVARMERNCKEWHINPTITISLPDEEITNVTGFGIALEWLNCYVMIIFYKRT